MIKIAVMGYGVVGSGVVELVGGHKELLKKALGEEISVKKILVRREYKECSVSELFTQKVEDIIEDDEISVVVEAIGGVNPALNYVSWALEKGKSVVTSNKELIATHGYELMQLAIKNGVNLLFEASVGGAIPIIRPMNTCLAANNITKIQGILNGTTNFILSKMHSDKLSFSLALKQAQELGYAESDPTADVEGIDALRKICILSSMAYGKHIYPKYITPQGISKISSEDDEIAGGLNGVIKLIAYSKKQEDGRAFLRVSPCFIKNENILSNVNDSFNAVKITADSAGDVVMYGRGAGSLPTASAVVADVINAVKDKNKRIYAPWQDGNQDDVSNIPPESQYFIRVLCANDGQFDRLTKGLSAVKIGESRGFLSDVLTGQQLKTLENSLKEEGVKLLSVYPVAD